MVSGKFRIHGRGACLLSLIKIWDDPFRSSGPRGDQSSHVSDSIGFCVAGFMVPKKRIWPASGPRGKVFNGGGWVGGRRQLQEGLRAGPKQRPEAASSPPSRPGPQTRSGFPGSRGRRAWPGAELGVPRLGEEPGRRQWTQRREGRRLREQPGGGTWERAPRPLPPSGPLPLCPLPLRRRLEI